MSKWSNKYWEKRRELEDLARLKAENDTIKLLQDILPEALKNIQAKLLSQADLHDMTQAELLEEFSKRDQKKYRKYIDQNYKELMNSDEKYQEFIDEYFPPYDYAKVNRLLQLRTDIFSELAASMVKKDATGKFNKRLEDIVNRTYNSNVNALTYLLGGDVSPLPKAELEAIMNYPWSGKTFSNRLWGNVSKLEQRLSTAVSTAIASGGGLIEALKTMRGSSEIADMFKLESTKFNNAIENLVRTEYSHFAVEGIRASFKATGVPAGQVFTAEDERVCSICGKKHKQVVEEGDEPPYHGRCRCTLMPKMPELDTEAIDKEYEALFGDTLDEFASGNWGVKLNHLKANQSSKIVYNEVDDDLESKLQKQSDEWIKTLLSKERAAVANYTDEWYNDMNGLLNDPNYSSVDDDYVLYNVANFESAINKFKLKDDLVVYRGISKNEYEKILSGNKFNDFKSTSVDKVIAERFADSMDGMTIRINVSKGTNAGYIGYNSDSPDEKELIINRGATYTVKETSDGLEVTINGSDKKELPTFEFDDDYY
jgi:hypothetical protein